MWFPPKWMNKNFKEDSSFHRRLDPLLSTSHIYSIKTYSIKILLSECLLLDEINTVGCQILLIFDSTRNESGSLPWATLQSFLNSEVGSKFSDYSGIYSLSTLASESARIILVKPGPAINFFSYSPKRLRKHGLLVLSWEQWVPVRDFWNPKALGHIKVFDFFWSEVY